MHHTVRLTFLAAAATLSAPASALAAPVPVTSASIIWTQANVYDALPARTFLGHTTNPGSVFQGRSNGTVSVSAGASLLSPTGTALQEVGPASQRGLGEAYAFGFPVSSGTIDRAAKSVRVQATGALTYFQYPALTPAPPAPVKISDLRVELSGQSGAVYADVTGPSGAVDYPASPARLFSLSVANAQTVDLGGGRVAISGLVPTLQRADVFGSAGQYPVGVAGPDRTPNTFGAFSLTITTGAPGAAEPAAVIEKQTILERVVSVDKTSRLLKLRLGRTPFSNRSVVSVTVTKRDASTAIGEGFTFGNRLWVVVPNGVVMQGKYSLRRTSGSKKLPASRSVTVTGPASAKR